MRMTQSELDGKIRLVAVHSRKMMPAEQNYNIYNKEILAIITVFKI